MKLSSIKFDQNDVFFLAGIVVLQLLNVLILKDKEFDDLSIYASFFGKALMSSQLNFE